ncbi:MAG: hypothetical protein FJW35_12860 [Acidobacteria bacterium]|nr:hypothetical protein [Acidobacteriota bacterium]
MMGGCSITPFTAEELEIFARLREVRRKFELLEGTPPAAGEGAGAREARLAGLRAEWRQLRQQAERARSRRMYYLGHSDLLDADSI